jgi:molybdate transport repressor ModE-like protein
LTDKGPIMLNPRQVLTPDSLAMLKSIDHLGSFAAAARAMGLVPSALSYRVRQMEEALDVLLFNRAARQARLTAAGRELLQEGMSKLKDTLSQMGMNVASMHVGDGQTQKRGGESTRGQMSKSTNSNANDPQSSLSAAQTSAPRMKMGQDGWDVLV